jgi:hypothetical protein
MYIHNEKILEYIENNTDKKNVKELLLTIYNNLFINKVITQNDLNILNQWISYF